MKNGMLVPAASTTRQRPTVLFINYKEERCGVYQYGKNLFEAISKSAKYVFHYVEVSSLEDLDRVWSRHPSRSNNL